MSILHPLCKNCIYWVAERTSDAPTAGHCHRYPPGIYVRPDTGGVVQKFPMTDHHQWCGEWSNDRGRLSDAVRQSTMRSIGENGKS